MVHSHTKVTCVVAISNNELIVQYMTLRFMENDFVQWFCRPAGFVSFFALLFIHPHLLSITDNSHCRLWFPVFTLLLLVSPSPIFPCQTCLFNYDESQWHTRHSSQLVNFQSVYIIISIIIILYYIIIEIIISIFIYIYFFLQEDWNYIYYINNNFVG